MHGLLSILSNDERKVIYAPRINDTQPFDRSVI